MSLFRKPKRNVQQRQIDLNDDDDDVKTTTHDDEDPSLEELQSSIAKFKEKKSGKSKNKKQSKVDETEAEKEKKIPSQLLSFDEDLLTGDDGEVFRVKKSSQSRRLMKQKKLDKKRKELGFGNEEFEEGSNQNEEPGVMSLPDLDLKIRDNIPRKEAPTSWTISGKEAEALHAESEDEEEEEEESDPIQKMLKSGLIPDAAAIHAARKQRQAVRDGGIVTSSASYIPINKKSSANNSADDESPDEDDDNVRIKFAGIKSGKRQGNGQMVVEDDDEHGWEEQQIRKAILKNPTLGPEALFPPPPPVISGHESIPYSVDSGFDLSKIDLNPKSAITYNLEGIKGRLQQRLLSLNEVHRRHETDLDKIVDDLVSSQSEIQNLESRIPVYAERHRFFQDLRGYVTDLVECFNEKVLNIKYLEDKLIRVKADMTKKLMERRREDVRDQMKELSAASQTQTASIANPAEESARQRRSAERDGRRRRRMQHRATSQKSIRVQHFEGLSSDDEISSLDQANLGKSRSEIESQARQIMADVVEDFSTLEGVKQRFEAWKQEDPESYTDAFVSLCLPRIVSPLVRLQLLFWNPLTEHCNIETMDWYNSLVSFSMPEDEDEDESFSDFEKDPDRKLLTLVVEKVLVVKMTAIISATYDAMSTTQTLKLTGTINRLIDNYPTLTGDSKQMRDLLTAVKDRCKISLEQDVYIPLGYPKQSLENASSGHSKFLSRQFWGAFKLFKNILGWYGILSDKILIELAIGSLLCRYLIIALTITPDPNDVLVKCRFITAALPSEWIKSGLYQNELKRFSQFLFNLALTAKQGPEFIREVSQLLSFIGEKEEVAKLNKTFKTN